MQWLIAGLFFLAFLIALPWLLRRSITGARKNPAVSASITALGMLFVSPRKLIPREDVTDARPVKDRERAALHDANIPDGNAVDEAESPER